jgi:hypothetical protein
MKSFSQLYREHGAENEEAIKEYIMSNHADLRGMKNPEDLDDLYADINSHAFDEDREHHSQRSFLNHQDVAEAMELYSS